MTLVLDAGALIALERDDRDMWVRLNAARASGTAPVTHGGVIARVWRGGTGRQAMLARALKGVQVVALDDELGRRAGLLLSRADTKDVVGAAVVALVRDGDIVVTSDPDDIAALAAVHAAPVRILPV